MYDLRSVDLHDSRSHQWRIVTPNVPFVIDRVTGVLSAAGELTEEQYTFEVEVTDGGGLTDTGQVTIVVDPAFDYLDAGEATPVGTVLGRVPFPPLNHGSATYRLEDDHGGRYAIDPVTGEIRLLQPLPYRFGEADVLTVLVSDRHGHEAKYYVAIGDQSEEPHLDFETNFDPEYIPGDRIDAMVTDGLAVRHGRAVVISQPTGKIVLEKIIEVGGINFHYSLAGVAPRNFGDEAAADHFVNDKWDDQNVHLLLFGSEFLLNLVPGGATADAIIRGDTEGIVKEGVADVLMTALVFARPLKLGATAIKGLAAAQVGWDVAVGSWDGLQAMRFVQAGQAGQGAERAAEALLRLFGVPITTSQRKILIELMKEGKFDVKIYNKTSRTIGFELENQRIRIERGQTATAAVKVRPRRGTDIEVVEAADGRLVAIYGTAKASTPATPGHKETIDRVARELAESGQYEFVTREKSWATATDGITTDGRLPDIIAVGKDGKVYAWEVRSATDNPLELQWRLDDALQVLPPEMRGIGKVIEIAP